MLSYVLCIVCILYDLYMFSYILKVKSVLLRDYLFENSS